MGINYQFKGFNIRQIRNIINSAIDTSYYSIFASDEILWLLIITRAHAIGGGHDIRYR